MSDVDLEFFFDPVCPYCWVTSRWVKNVAEHRPMRIVWRPLSLRLINEDIGYETRPADYPHAHQRGLEMLRVAAAGRNACGEDVLGDLYTAMGEAVWNSPAPEEASFEAVLAEETRRRDLDSILAQANLPAELATAAGDESWDADLRAETEEAIERVGGELGTPILSFSPPDGPAFFGPVIDEPPEGEDALRLWDAVVTLGSWPGFAELKRSQRSFPATPLTARIAHQETTVR
jgi:2-hydroxychromene-2-carboxylate isomerase